MRAAGLMEETRELFGRIEVDIFPEQLLKPISETALAEAVARVSRSVEQRIAEIPPGD